MKVGHRQVVNMIRQGGNHLVLKVVTVTRNLDPDDTARKKGTFFSFPNGIFSVLLHRKQAMGTMLIYKLPFLNL